MSELIFSVSQINQYLQDLLASDDFLQGLYIKGEVANIKYHNSGHIYFSLKDIEKESSLRCIMFKSNAANLTFNPKDGDEILVGGRIATYIRDGTYQLYAHEIIDHGLGKLQKALEELKNKLRAKNYFDEDIKKPLPLISKNIGVITSPNGAAWHDIKKVAKKRWQNINLLLYPTAVQGSEAPKSIALSIEKANQEKKVDLLIVGRGGGSAEDLAAFNSEAVADAIFKSKLPTISAVGHETDFSIADLVADIRAATPSAAAEIAVPDADALENQLDNLYSRILKAALQQINDQKEAINYYKKKNIFTETDLLWQNQYQSLENIKNDFLLNFKAQQNNRQNKIANLASLLDVLSPLTTLKRGYSICEEEIINSQTKTKEHKVIYKAKKINPKNKLKVNFTDGSVICTVDNINIK